FHAHRNRIRHPGTDAGRSRSHPGAGAAGVRHRLGRLLPGAATRPGGSAGAPPARSAPENRGRAGPAPGPARPVATRAGPGVSEGRSGRPAGVPPRSRRSAGGPGSDRPGRVTPMRFRALATDYDGTLAHDGHVDAPTVDALRRLRDSGRLLILVTGREL